MVKLDEIREVAVRIGREFRPRQVVLFGSYARGNPTPDSDVDLLIILPFKGKSAAKAADIRLRVRPAFPVDLLVRTPANVRKRMAMGDDFLREIIEEGDVLYEADDA